MGRARSMTLRRPVEMAVMRGREGSSENSARHSLLSASGQTTERESVVEETRTGPGVTAVMSTGMAAWAVAVKARRKKAVMITTHSIAGSGWRQGKKVLST